MSTFTVPEEFADLRLYSGGRNYEFAGVECSVEDEADAKRIRIFAVEHPEYGIAEDGETVGYMPAPEEDNAEDPAPADATVEAEAANDDDDAQETTAPKPLERMNRAELVAAAEARGVEIPDNATKADIKAALEEA